MKLDEYLRPEVQKFAVMMEKRLRANDHKGGWMETDRRDLFIRCIEELGEFVSAWYYGITGKRGGEAADVANFLMMLVDRDNLLENFK